MNTNQLIVDEIHTPAATEATPAAPKPKRMSTVFPRLRARLAKATNLQKAGEYARLLTDAGTRSKVLVKSVVREFGISVRAARMLRDAAKPKHRRRRL